MAKIVKIKNIIDQRGYLTVFEKNIPFKIKRVFVLSNLKKNRGGHKHKKTILAISVFNGSCKIDIFFKKRKKTFILNKPGKCLIIYKNEWHLLRKISKYAIIVVLASQFFKKNDYIDEK
jgi:hypothetical protein